MSSNTLCVFIGWPPLYDVFIQEVTGGIILGYLLLGEVPGFHSLLEAAITLTGIAMVLI
jgi:hypothetical protein